MTEKRFVIKNERTIIDNETRRNGYVFSWKSDAEEICDLLNSFVNENEQLKKDATVLIQANQDYRRENDRIKSLLLKKIKDLNNDYQQSAKNGMPTGGIIGELDSFEEICEIMGWMND